MLYITSAEPEESGIKSSYAVIGATKEKGKKKDEGRKASNRSSPSKADREMKVVLNCVEPIEPHPILS
jgi:hypothetical protein